MKKTSCFLLLAAWVGLCSTPLSAQTSFGLHGGLNYGEIHYSNKPPQLTSTYTPGYFLGATVGRHISKSLNTGLDAQFALKASDASALGETDFQSCYLEIVPRAEYFFTKNISVSLGLYAAYLMEQRGRLDKGAWFRTDKILDVRPVDMGIVPGVAFRYGRAFGFLRYTHGLVAMYKIEYTNEQGESAGTSRATNRYFQAGIGYVIFE